MSFISHLFGSPALTAAVGKGVPNTNASDVRTVQALLNAYRRNKNQQPLTTDGKADHTLTAAIEDFQKQELQSASPDGRIDPGGKTINGLLNSLRSCYTTLSVTAPTQGALTWDAEGSEGGRYHSRRLHVPSNSSGLTLGRGYDMKQRTGSAILSDLVKAGVPADWAQKISSAAGKHGSDASKTVVDGDALDFEITPQSQLKLFESVYDEHVQSVKDISDLSRVVRDYGKVSWDKLDQRILNVLVDLRYRGDYTERSRVFLQPHVVKNDFKSFKAEIIKESNWPEVIQQAPLRFEQRSEYVQTAPAIS